jgi:transcription elongation factor Elf1
MHDMCLLRRKLIHLNCTPSADLSKPIDVYCKWIDACEELNGVAETEEDLARQMQELSGQT